MSLTLVASSAHLYAPWRALWDGYCDFYQAKVPDEITLLTWNAMLDPAGAIRGRIALLDHTPVGFVTYLLHPSTWERSPICYLEDLFVDPNVRGQGIGRALIDFVIAEAKANGWPRVYWHTKSDNPSRKLYDRYVSADDMVRYVVRL